MDSSSSRQIAQAFIDRLMAGSTTKASNDDFTMGELEKLDAELTVIYERAKLQARLDACERAIIELFTLLARHATEALPPLWATLLDILAAEERFWIWPANTVAQLEDGIDVIPPHLNRSRIAEEWSQLLDHATRVLSARQSAERHDLTA